MTFFAYKLPPYEIHTHVPRVFGIPFEILSLLTVRACDEPLLLVAFEEVLMHSLFRYAGVREYVRLLALRVLEARLIIGDDGKLR